MLAVQPLAAEADNGLLRFITCGSVDDGKSTLIGRLLLDTKSILANGGFERGDTPGRAPADWRKGAAIAGVEYLWDRTTNVRSQNECHQKRIEHARKNQTDDDHLQIHSNDGDCLVVGDVSSGHNFSDEY